MQTSSEVPGNKNHYMGEAKDLNSKNFNCDAESRLELELKQITQALEA